MHYSSRNDPIIRLHDILIMHQPDQDRMKKYNASKRAGNWSFDAYIAADSRVKACISRPMRNHDEPCRFNSVIQTKFYRSD